MIMRSQRLILIYFLLNSVKIMQIHTFLHGESIATYLLSFSRTVTHRSNVICAKGGLLIVWGHDQFAMVKDF